KISMLSLNSSPLREIVLVLIITVSSVSAFRLADATHANISPAQVRLDQPVAKAAPNQPVNIQSTSVSTQTNDLVAAQMFLGVMPANAGSEQSPGELWRRTELYFGSEKPDGSVVMPQDFEDFVDEIVTPRFPDGLTLLTGYGQWRDSAGVIIEEESNVLILLYPMDDKEANGEIEQIRNAYKDTFQQESVLRVDDYSQVSF
ncbi:MAG: DUF3574 domain-containing protein, partial [Anaerolineae bacterium]